MSYEINLKELSDEQLYELIDDCKATIKRRAPFNEVLTVQVHENDCRIYLNGKEVMQDKLEYILDYHGSDCWEEEWYEDHISNKDLLNHKHTFIDLEGSLNWDEYDIDESEAIKNALRKEFGVNI